MTPKMTPKMTTFGPRNNRLSTRTAVIFGARLIVLPLDFTYH